MSEPSPYEFDAFISYSSRDKEWVFGYLVPALEAGGIRLCVDREQFGGNLAIRNIEQAVVASRRTVLVLTPDWLESRWTEIEFQMAAILEPAGPFERVVPLLHKPIDPPPRLAILSYVDLTDDRHDGEIELLLQTLRGTRTLPAERRLVHLARPQRSAAERATMIRRVRRDWIDGYLAREISHIPPLQPRLEPHERDVRRGWRLQIEISAADRFLPAGSTMATVLETVRDPFVIVGEPGAGKTIALLELAKELLERAERDPRASLPVVLTLSEWRDDDEDLIAWVVGQLNQRYQVPRDLARLWLTEEQLVLLLDGLDEIPEDRRGRCVDAINTFRREHGRMDVVVTCRIAEFLALAAGLAFQVAVRLHRLSPEQVRDAVTAAGSDAVMLGDAIAADGELADLGRNPLMLGLLLATCQGVDVADKLRARGTISLRDRVLDRFVDQALVRRRGDPDVSPEGLRSTLQTLAFRLREHGQSVFLPQHLQMSWLSGWHLGYSCLAAAIGATVLTLPFAARTFAIRYAGPRGGGGVALVGTAWLMSFVVALPFSTKPVETMERVGWNARRAMARLAYFVSFSLFSVFVYWTDPVIDYANGGVWRLPANELFAPDKMRRLTAGLRVAGMVVLGLGPLVFIGSGISQTVLGKRRIRTGDAMRATLRNALLLGAAAAAVLLLLIRYAPGASTLEAVGEADVTRRLFLRAAFVGCGAAGTFLVFGGFAWIKHQALRIVLGATGELPFRLGRVLTTAVDRGLLRRVADGHMFVHGLVRDTVAAQYVPAARPGWIDPRWLLDSKTWSSCVGAWFGTLIGLASASQILADHGPARLAGWMKFHEDVIVILMWIMPFAVSLGPLAWSWYRWRPPIPKPVAETDQDS